MTAQQGYNGWANYETWNVHLWVTNDEGAYRSILAYREADGGEFDAAGASECVKCLFPSGTPDMEGPSDYDKVDWVEVAEALNEL